MKTIKILTVVLLSWCMAVLPVLATLTATVTPGYTFSANERPTVGTLNELGFPTVLISGTVDGSTGLTAGSVAGNLLADSVPDGVTLNYNGGAPRQLQILPGGVSWMQFNTNGLGRGLAGGWSQGAATGTNLNVTVDGVTISFTTNGLLTIPAGFLAGVFFVFPATPNFTNTWGTTSTFLITNFNTPVPSNQVFYVTNFWRGTVITTNNTAQTIADGDQVAMLSTLQTSNTVAQLKAMAQYAQYKARFTGGGAYTNLHRLAAFFFAGATTNGASGAATTYPLFLNTNADFSMDVNIGGSWTSTAGNSFTTYVGDENTNNIFTIDNSTQTATVDRNRFILPPHYGIYLLRTAGGGSATFALNIEAIPY